MWLVIALEGDVVQFDAELAMFRLDFYITSEFGILLKCAVPVVKVMLTSFTNKVIYLCLTEWWPEVQCCG